MKVVSVVVVIVVWQVGAKPDGLDTGTHLVASS